MIVMIMAQEDRINSGKVLPPHAWLPAAARTNHGERTCPLRPDRIGQNVGAALLEQHGGVVDQRNLQLVCFYAERRFRLHDVRNETGRRLRPAGQLPSQDVEEAAR